ncbi:MAG: Allergen V5/Tpx family protein [Polaromonas sp.]|nr:Allergen V5/Tpx family protein [Polaromonas sp.]MDB5846233.1 Allergen V5/Tpx family protein [Polaromonas sp.]
MASPNATIVTNIAAAPSYAAGSEELAAYLLLNAERSRCGFGLLAASAPLDAAARAHADYQIINSQYTHQEIVSQFPDGFTGADPVARVRAQGYTDLGAVSDEIAMFMSSNPAQSKLGFGEKGIRGLLNAPYHLSGLMSGFRDVGVAVRSNDDTGRGQRAVFVQVNAAHTASAGPQLPGSTDVQTYPCEGSTGLNRQLTDETPNPVPGRDLVASPLGSTVYIAVRPGNRLTITSAAMTQAASGQAVMLRKPITSENDPYAASCQQTGCFLPHQGYVVPEAPLLANTAYTVMLGGTNNGVAFSRSFTFSTGSGG